MMCKDILILYLTSILAIGIADNHDATDCYSSLCFQDMIKKLDDAENKLNQIMTATYH